MSAEGFWDDNQRANKLISQNNQLKSIVDTYTQLKTSFLGLQETVELIKESFDQEMKEMVEEEYLSSVKTFDEFEVNVLLSHDYDKSNAIEIGRASCRERV